MITTRPTAWRSVFAVAILTAISVALTFGFACGVPLAAFATIAALLLPLGAAVSAMLAVWAANQAVGFACLHYPTNASTIEWGLTIGVIGLLALAACRVVQAGRSRTVQILASFSAAFAVYEGAIYVACIVSGTGTASFTAPIVGRILLINVASLGGLLALWALTARARPAPGTAAASGVSRALTSARA